METFGASKKRKADPDESPEEKLCKPWRSYSDTVLFLKKRSKMEFQCQREELEIKRYEQQKQQQQMISMLQQQDQRQQQMQQKLEQMQTELMETRKCMATLLQKISEQK